VGTDRYRETSVMGSAVNLAARLQGAAQAGEVLIGPATRHLTRHAFNTTPVTLSLKGLGVAVKSVRIKKGSVSGTTGERTSRGNPAN
jgi:class 3 adenylate cyclase